MNLKDMFAVYVKFDIMKKTLSLLYIMQKIVYTTSDILEEFFRRAGMKWLDKEAIDRTVPIIFSDSFQLVKVVRKIDKVRTMYYLCEWVEDGIQDSDEWTRPWERFVWAIAENYIYEAMRL